VDLLNKVQKVLTTYYGENLEDHNQLKPPHEIGPAERLLARQYWKGQMHGGSEHPVHARHMRPRCSSIPELDSSLAMQDRTFNSFTDTTRTTASPPASPTQGPSRRPSTRPTERPKSLSLDVGSTLAEAPALTSGISTVIEAPPQPMQNFALFVCSNDYLF